MVSSRCTAGMVANFAPRYYICACMRITLLTVGKTDIAWVRQGLEMYVSRLEHYVPFSLKEMPELKGVTALTREQFKQREGEMILRQLAPSDEVVLQMSTAASTARWSSRTGWADAWRARGATWSS